MKFQCVYTSTKSQVYDTSTAENARRIFRLLLEELEERYDIKEEEIEVFPLDVKVD